MKHANAFKSLVLPLMAASIAAAGSVMANEVTFIDGGYAEMCSSVAHNVDQVDYVELTGTRMSISPIEICTKAIEDFTGTPRERAGSYTNRGVLLFDEGRLEEALRDFDQAIVLAETLAAAHINRGYTLIAMQRWADSIPSLDRGIELGAPEPARAHFNRAIAHEEVGNVRAAYDDYRKASELQPEWEEPQRELARFRVR